MYMTFFFFLQISEYTLFIQQFPRYWLNKMSFLLMLLFYVHMPLQAYQSLLSPSPFWCVLAKQKFRGSWCFPASSNLQELYKKWAFNKVTVTMLCVLLNGRSIAVVFLSTKYKENITSAFLVPVINMHFIHNSTLFSEWHSCRQLGARAGSNLQVIVELHNCIICYWGMYYEIYWGVLLETGVVHFCWEVGARNYASTLIHCPNYTKVASLFK